MPAAYDSTTTLPQLLDPADYRACRWDLVEEADKRAYWIDLFRSHFDKLLKEAERVGGASGGYAGIAPRRGVAAKRAFTAYLDAVASDPTRYGPLNILRICWQRERTLRAHGFADPYRLAKSEADEAAMQLLPGVLRRLDAIAEAGDERGRREAVIRGVFAGNLYDLGATKTVDLFEGGGPTFDKTLESLTPRPWFRDDLDAWLARLDGEPHRCALMFVDNAGTDVVLGMIPFARFLLGRGTRVILAANTDPSLNDTTHAELVPLVTRVAAEDAALGEGLRTRRLRLIASGNGAPLIDLTRLSPALVREAKRAAVDLLVIEGMGRAIESNLDARFTCDTLKVAMIKDEGVAEAMGAELFDLMLRFEPAPGVAASPG